MILTKRNQCKGKKSWRATRRHAKEITISEVSISEAISVPCVASSNVCDNNRILKWFLRKMLPGERRGTCSPEAVNGAPPKRTQSVDCLSFPLRRKKCLHNGGLFIIIIMIIRGDNMLREEVEGVLEKIRIGLRSEGGDIELVDIKEHVIYVRLKGSCSTCSMSSLTMKNWVEATLRKEIPEITAVQTV